MRFLLTPLLLCATGLRADDFKPPSPQRINKAIEDGVAWLKSNQRKDGSWGPCTAGAAYNDPNRGPSDCYFTGPTSFALFTLAKCGVTRKDPVVKKGLKWLRKEARQGNSGVAGSKGYKYTSYESASVVLMLTALNPPRNKKRKLDTRKPMTKPGGSSFKKDDWRWLHERVIHLVGQTGTRGRPCQNVGGGWGYWRRRNGYADVSATQFALLALRAASSAGYPVDVVAPGTWRRALDYCRTMQEAGGGFRYNGKEPWSAGMTAAGIASLVICKEQLLLRGEQPPVWIDDVVKRGLDHLGTVFDVSRNRNAKDKKPFHYHYYYLYGVERVGDLTGKREMGGKDWYLRGAAWLLANQATGGLWNDGTCMKPRDTLGTCFALLFLKKATPRAITISGD